MRLESEKNASSNGGGGDAEFAKPKSLHVELGDEEAQTEQQQQQQQRPVMTLDELNQTTFARLLRILKHPVIRDNRSLIDKMLNLLG